MKNTLNTYLEEVKNFNTDKLEDVENFRIKFLGKTGILNNLFEEFKKLPPESKKELGKDLNVLKQESLKKVNFLKEKLNITSSDLKIQDPTLDGSIFNLGKRHPITKTLYEIVNILSKIGFKISDGPEIEDDWHNFTALNIPEYHPARDMQDTFFIDADPEKLLRTHTSSVQTRHMEENKPPIRIISPGRVFRNEDISYRSHCMFHQVEGLYIDKNVSFADLKQTLLYLVKELFGKTKIRLRPSYFPFTEPSAEVDIYWGLNSEADYRITKGTGWLEIMGCGMVDPNVLKNVGIDSKEYSGFAFGMGIERTVMLLYQVNDLRHYFNNDLRFLSQF